MEIRVIIDSDRGQIGPTVLRKSFTDSEAEERARSWIKKNALVGDFITILRVISEYRYGEKTI